MRVTDKSIEKLKRALREDSMPLLSDEDLEDLLESSESFNEAVYRGAIIKSEDTTLQVSGLSIADTSSYFLRLASIYRPNNTGILRGGA